MVDVWWALDAGGDAGGVQLYGLQCYLWGKRWVGRARCDFFGWLDRRGSYCQVDFTGLETWIKKMSILAPDRDAPWNLGNCFTAGFGRKFWLSKLQHD